MKSKSLGLVLAILAFAPLAVTSAAAVNAGSAATSVIAIQSRAEQTRSEQKKNKDKDKVHGAEMSTTAVAAAGVFALSAYFFFVRRNQKRA